MPLLCTSLLTLLLLPLSLSCDYRRAPTDVREAYMATVRTDLENTPCCGWCGQPCKEIKAKQGNKLRIHKRKKILLQRENISSTLQNTPCPEKNYKLRNCTSNSNVEVIVSTLHHLTCKMKNSRLDNTGRLVISVLSSIKCSCHEKPTKGPRAMSKKKRTVTRRRRNEQRMSRRETNNFCRVKAILSTMTECYQMMNAILMT